MKHTCPVCYYSGLSDPPDNYMICPSCGTEFENDDEEFTHEELRQKWIAKGMRWVESELLTAAELGPPRAPSRDERRRLAPSTGAVP